MTHEPVFEKTRDFAPHFFITLSELLPARDDLAQQRLVRLLVLFELIVIAFHHQALFETEMLPGELDDLVQLLKCGGLSLA